MYAVHKFNIRNRLDCSVFQILGDTRACLYEQERVLLVPELDRLIAPNNWPEEVVREVSIFAEDFCPICVNLLINVVRTALTRIRCRTNTTSDKATRLLTSVDEDSSDRCSAVSIQIARSNLSWSKAMGSLRSCGMNLMRSSTRSCIFTHGPSIPTSSVASPNAFNQVPIPQPRSTTDAGRKILKTCSANTVADR